MNAVCDFMELLKAVTVDCKDNGEFFTVTDRLVVIEQLLAATPYRLIARRPLALLFAKKEIGDGDKVILISSHVDCVYEKCFCTDEGECVRGTFDNSFGNAAVLWNMIIDTLPDNVIVTFTGNEEKDSRGALQVLEAVAGMNCFPAYAIVQDVTNVGWDSSALFTIENDAGIDSVTAYNLVSLLECYGGRFAFMHNAEPDESWEYAENGIPSLSLCLPVCGELHCENGVLLRKESALVYCSVLAQMATLLAK